jgi:hypothetical protein
MCPETNLLLSHRDKDKSQPVVKPDLPKLYRIYPHFTGLLLAITN